MTRLRLVLLFLLAPIQANTLAETPAQGSNTQLVQQFLAAFNAHDSAAMGDLVTQEVKWLSIADGTLSIELQGRLNLVNAMDEYFESCSSCRSRISQLMPSRDRLSAIEIATWETDAGTASQQSLSIYEFSGSQISAVYYFPAESIPSSTGAADDPR